MVRFCLIVASTALLGTVTFAQELPRYGVSPLIDLYEQGTPQETLNSAIRAIEKRRSNYLAAFLVDPTYVDGWVNRRINLLLPSVEKQLQAERADQQRANVPQTEQLPINPIEFAAVAKERAKDVVFNQLAREIQASLTENPQRLALLRRFARSGTVDIQGNSATISLPDMPKQAVYLTLVGERWYIENRQTKPQP